MLASTLIFSPFQTNGKQKLNDPAAGFFFRNGKNIAQVGRKKSNTETNPRAPRGWCNSFQLSSATPVIVLIFQKATGSSSSRVAHLGQTRNGCLQTRDGSRMGGASRRYGWCKSTWNPKQTIVYFMFGEFHPVFIRKYLESCN